MESYGSGQWPAGARVSPQLATACDSAGSDDAGNRRIRVYRRATRPAGLAKDPDNRCDSARSERGRAPPAQWRRRASDPQERVGPRATVARGQRRACRTDAPRSIATPRARCAMKIHYVEDDDNNIFVIKN